MDGGTKVKVLLREEAYVETLWAERVGPDHPDVKCTGHPYRLVGEAPKLVPEPKP